jgi:glycosyltransferase involved in cell wall biosynthesis
MVKITYLVTVFNEEKTVKKAITDVLDIKYKNKEIIVIDNGSTDTSQKIIKKFKNIKKVLRKKNIGFGKSVTEGIKNAKGKYIFIQYSDLEYDHKRSIYMMKLAEKKKLDVVMGSRLKNYNYSMFKLIIKKPAYLATLICTFLINKFYNHKFTDIIGAKLYNVNSVKKIRTNSYNAGFDFEFMSRACKEKFRISEVSIKYWPRINSREKKIKFYHMFNALYEIFKVKLFN